MELIEFAFSLDIKQFAFVFIPVSVELIVGVERFKSIISTLGWCCAMVMLLKSMIEEDQGLLVHHKTWKMMLYEEFVAISIHLSAWVKILTTTTTV